MEYDPIITVNRFEEVREKLDDDIWTDYEVFDEERNKVPVKEIVIEVVLDNVKTSNSVYGVENSAAELVRDIVVSDNELVPDGIPEDVQQKFAGKLGDVVKEEAAKLYREVRKNINITDDGEISSEAQDVIQELAEQRVQDEY